MPPDALVVNKRLADVQREALADAGIREVVAVASEAELPAPGGEPYLVVGDDLFFSKSLLKAFLAEASPDARAGRGARLAILECRSVLENAPAQDLVAGTTSDGRSWRGYPMWLVGAGGARVALADLPACAVDAKEEIKTIEGIPRVFSNDRKISFPITSRVAIRLQHWVHILRANQLAMMAGVVALRERPRVLNWLAIAWILLKSFPPTEARIGRTLVQRGRKVKIHPTAVVEAAILGDGVKIGAHATVRASVLGPGVVVEDYGYVEMSVLGEGAAVTKKAISNFNVLYPGAVVGHVGCQMSLVGYDGFVSTDSRIFDLKFDGEVPIEHRGRRISSGARFLGACVGHRATVGAGIFLQYGIAVPNGAVLAKDPREVVRKIARDVPEGKPLIVSDGVAEPFGKGMRKATARGTDRVAAAKAADVAAPPAAPEPAAASGAKPQG